jgi:glutaredoxin
MCVLVKELINELGVLDKCEIKNCENPMFKMELMKMGYMGVPLLVIGNQEILGFDREKIELAIKGEFDV